MFGRLARGIVVSWGLLASGCTPELGDVPFACSEANVCPDGYSCQSTSRTPNWGCWYGKPAGPEGTPLITVNKGSRTMLVQSRQKPKVTYNASTKTYTTTVSR